MKPRSCWTEIKFKSFRPLPNHPTVRAQSRWRRNHRINPEGRLGETPNPEVQTPNTKLQTPKKSQAPNPNSARDVAVLELVIWSFSGVWSLVFGAWCLVFESWELVFRPVGPPDLWFRVFAATL